MRDIVSTIQAEQDIIIPSIVAVFLSFQVVLALARASSPCIESRICCTRNVIGSPAQVPLGGAE